MMGAILDAIIRIVTGADAAHRRKVKAAREAAAMARVAASEAEYMASVLDRDHEARARAGRQGAGE